MRKEKNKRMPSGIMEAVGHRHRSGVFKLACLAGMICVSQAFAKGAGSGRLLPETDVWQQENSRVTGTVVDQDGLPVIGANVMVKGTTNGTITDMDGKFALEGIEKGTVLQISYIGFANQEITVGSQRDLSVTLKEDAEALDELVVVGYGVQKKGDLTGAVISIKNEKLNKYATGNVGNALQGQMAGVDITSKSGKPGAGVDVKIRGTSSLGNSTPLYLIDGIPSDINNISPNDIESIEALKDGAAAAIYGSRAANGVVLITSKRARSGKATVSLNAYFGIEAIAKKIL